MIKLTKAHLRFCHQLPYATVISQRERETKRHDFQTIFSLSKLSEIKKEILVSAQASACEQFIVLYSFLVKNLTL